MRPYRSFIRLTIILTLTLIIAASALNICTDPFGIWRPHGDQGITNGNRLFEYRYKPYQAEALNPKVIFLGNSRACWGIPPEYPGFPPGTVYNFGVTGAHLLEIQTYLNFSLTTFHPEIAVIGLAYEMFTDAEYDFSSMFPHDMFRRAGSPLHIVDKFLTSFCQSRY